VGSEVYDSSCDAASSKILQDSTLDLMLVFSRC